MSAPRKYDEEFRDRAIRMFRERLAEPGVSKLAARRHVGALLGLNQATLRGWVEAAERAEGVRAPAARVVVLLPVSFGIAVLSLVAAGSES